MFNLFGKKKTTELVSPINGRQIPLEQVNDQVFSQKMVGDGIAIIPEDSPEFTVTAPVAGTISALFETLHAIGITTDEGLELLIHIGMDTVELGGLGFEALIKQGDKVTAGQTLLKVDHRLLTEKGIDLTTPIIISNANGYSYEFGTNETLKQNDDVIMTFQK